MRRHQIVAATLVVLCVSAGAMASPAGAEPGASPRCPRGEPDAFRTERLVDKRMRAARRIARRHDCSVRVVKRDGEWLPVTLDFSPSRINVVVRDRVVRRIDGVY